MNVSFESLGFRVGDCIRSLKNEKEGKIIRVERCDAELDNGKTLCTVHSSPYVLFCEFCGQENCPALRKIKIKR